ncbi:TIGR03620 family F420-dependent LLM class oxidoreductase [Myxococcota bacterium]|nr:TIGR03620 family F420-dependent LLM class oxidoreductase [Myxococcota bacterium]
MELGKIAVWGSLDGYALPEALEAAQRIESLGYPTFWHPMSMRRDLLLVASSLLAHTERLILATGILPIFERPPAVMAAAQRTLAEQFPGRFVLGLGVSHPPIVEGMHGLDYGPPVTSMREYLDRMDAGLDLGALGGDSAAPAGAAATTAGTDPPRMLAALGPRMLALARDRSAGAHPYFMPPEHTRRAREILGPDSWLCVELKAVLETEPSRARELARMAGAANLALENYWKNWRLLGFEDADFQDRGSDRLIDATVAWGNLAAIERRIQEHLDAGATQVCVQAVHPSGRDAGLHWELIEALAPGR